jgi:hypothetical protein
MAERDRIESIVERIVGEVLQAHTVQSREEIVRRVTEESANLPASESPEAKNGVDSADLARAVSEIHAGSSQREILKALLDGCARYAARVALFVVKSGSATGWQGRGFSDSDGLKDFALDVKASAVSRAIGEHSVVHAQADEMDAHFWEQFGAPASESRLLPLLLKDKVAALVYADGGTDGAAHLDAGALDLLVLATSSWLEVNSLRKQVQKGPAAPVEGENGYSSPVPVAAASVSYSDPFATHAPSHAMAAAAAAEAAAPAMPVAVHAEAAVVEPEPAFGAAPVAAEPAAPADLAVSPDEQEAIRKAQRFARLLIDEIKLYNQAKVAEGRKKKDLYDRLKEPIEKSRVTYQKRYGNTVAGSNDYFQHELVRSLAEDDISLMGANFPK